MLENIFKFLNYFIFNLINSISYIQDTFYSQNKSLSIVLSHLRDSNSGPTVYKTVALPLS